MKNILFLLIFMTIAPVSEKDKELLLKKVIIAGKILNPDPDILKVDFAINRVGIGKERISPIIDNDGNFKMSFESYIPTDVWLRYKSNFLILTHPGDSIFVEFDGKKNESPDILRTIKFGGDACELNKEAASFQMLYYSSSLYSNHGLQEKAIREYDEVKYKSFMDSCKNEGINLLNSFVEEDSPSDEVRKWVSIFLDVSYYRSLIAYPYTHRITNNLREIDWDVPITYFDFLKERFTINDSIFLCGYALEGFVNSYSVYIHEKTREENKQFFSSIDTIKKYPAKMDSLRFFGTIKHTDDQILRQMALTEMLYQKLEQSEIRMFETYEDKINNYIQEPYLKEPLFNLYEQTLSRLGNPKLVSDAILRKLKGTSLKSDIESIISVNKGKVIYMDCWATWCGPCIAEMPNSKKLMEEYKTKNLAFVFICLDSEEKNWKSIIDKSSLGGQHFFLTRNQSSDFREIFGIDGIPHYILFDRDGDLLENGTLPPSAIKEKLDKLLNLKTCL